MSLLASLVLSLQPHVGLGSSDLTWNIAQDLSGRATPNVLSELEFEDMHSYQGGLDASLRGDLSFLGLQWLVEGSSNYGHIERGTATDTDYLGNNRTEIGSLAEAKIRGDRELAYSGGIGLVYHWAPRKQSFSLLLGSYFQEDDINMREGRQLIASPAFFASPSIDSLTRNLQERLDSNYLGEWSGYWLAAEYQVGWQAWRLSVRYRHYDGQYYGEGRWNLRTEEPFPLQQPKSFSHHADSSGGSWQLGVAYSFSERLGLHLDWSSGQWDSDPGTARIYFADGSVGRTRFNQAKRRASALRLGLSFTFR